MLEKIFCITFTFVLMYDLCEEICTYLASYDHKERRT